jgi:hypothetical protein
LVATDVELGEGFVAIFRRSDNAITGRISTGKVSACAMCHHALGEQLAASAFSSQPYFARLPLGLGVLRLAATSRWRGRRRATTATADDCVRQRKVLRITIH